MRIARPWSCQKNCSKAAAKISCTACPRHPKKPGSSQLRMCSLKAPVLSPVMQRATSSLARRKLLEASQQRCMDKNGPLLEELLQKRHAAACLLGFGSHAERVLAPKMAGSAERVQDFCDEMLERVRPLRDAELEKLTCRKKSYLAAAGDSPPSRKRKLPSGESTEDSNDKGEEDPEELKVWDVAFYCDLLKREEPSLDDEKLKEFFPLEGTIQRLLSVYSELLGLSFQRNASLPVWHDDVVAFEVKDNTRLIGHLFLDQFPLDGKFAHQVIVPLAPAFTDGSSGEVCVPACVNISNLPRPEGDKPALLRFSEMKTLFHETRPCDALFLYCFTVQPALVGLAHGAVAWGCGAGLLGSPKHGVGEVRLRTRALAPCGRALFGQPQRRTKARRGNHSASSEARALEGWDS
ncbi:unnamed protein product [Polarella glacialis]|uniref:Peptidase M3A/M3B catalytic domain-containing protein n=1 Tax=Polarella glacialis TaxID=89957 RepID=A0A813I605_POLGL|nr:unnamed protein product [Polarella glacialis]